MNFRTPTIPPPGTSACVATPSHVPGEKAGQQSTPQLEPDCRRAADSLSPRQIAIWKFNERFYFAFPDGTGRSDCCSSETIKILARIAAYHGAVDLAAELERSLEK